jgi:hypothetical protein
MALDRYSDDHTIEVVRGTQTVNIKDNLYVEEDASIGNDLIVSNDLNIVNDLDVGNNLNVTGDLVVAGSVTIDGATTINDNLDLGIYKINSSGYDYNSSISVFREIPIYDLYVASDPTSIGSLVDNMNTHDWSNSPQPNYRTIELGSSINTDWYFHFTIDPYLIHNASVTSIRFLLELSTGSDSTYDFNVQVYSIPNGDLTTPSSPTSISSDTITLLSAAGRQWYNASISFTADVEPTGPSKSYYVKFSKVPTTSCEIFIYRAAIAMSIDSVSMGLNKI